jgi:hypothetical protein
MIQLAPEVLANLAHDNREFPAVLVIIEPGGLHTRTYRCTNLAIEHKCDREDKFTVPEAEHLAARIDSANQYNVMALGATMENLPQPLVLVYGMPWERQPEEGEC